MAKNQESINRSLFELLRSRGYAPTLLDTSGKEIPVPEEAEVFQFKFTKDGEEYGTVTASIDGLHKLVIYFGDDVANSEKESTGGDESWYKLLNHLKRFAQQHQLSFEVKNTDHLKYDMAKREHMKKQERISEGYYPMGKKGSYSDAVPTTKIIIQHNKNIEEGEQRYRNVAKIFVENSEGERFAVPTTKPGIARVYARHIAEGGTPYDEKGKHITSICEEYQKMGAFVRATRNGQFNESAQRLVNEGINHYQSLRETLGRMTGHRGYTAYFESWTPPLMEDETDTSNLNELFVQETLDPRIESVMPILSKLHKKVAEMKEVDALSEWADSLTEAPGAETLKHNDDTEASNLKAFDLAEDGAELEPAIDELEETHPAVRKIKRRLGQVAKQNPGTNSTNSGLGKTYDNWKNNMTYKQLVKKDMIDKDGNIDMPGFKDDEEEYYEGFGDAVKKVGSAVKKAGSAVLNKLGHDDDTELLKKIQKDAGIPVQHGKPNMAKPNDDSDIIEGQGQQLSVQQLATISDEALDNAYKYGRSSPGNTFGWQANLKSAQFAKQMIDKGVTDIEAISDAIHKGWNVTAKAFVQNPNQFDDTEKLKAAGKLDAKLQQRAQLMKKNYSQLPEEEKEKDRVVARALLQAIKGQVQQDVAEDWSAPPQDTTGHGEFVRKQSGGNQNVYRLSQLLNDPSVESYISIGVENVAKPSNEILQGIKSKKWQGENHGADYTMKDPGGWDLKASNPMYFKEFLKALSQSVPGDRQIRVAIDPYVKSARAKNTDLAEDEFAGDYKTGPEGQWRNKGPKANKPAKVGDLVGASESIQNTLDALTEMDKSEDVKGPEGKATPIKAGKAKKDFAKMFQKNIDKANKEKKDTDEKVKQHQVKESIQLDEGVMDSIKGIVGKIKAIPGIQKFIQAAQAKKAELIQAAQQSRNGQELIKNIQAAVGGQQAVAEGWGQKLSGGLVASAGGGLMAAGAEMFMRAWNAMGKPDLAQMMNDPGRDGQIVLALVTMLVLVGALSLFGGGHMFKQGLEKDVQPMREGQEDLDAILRIIKK